MHWRDYISGAEKAMLSEATQLTEEMERKGIIKSAKAANDDVLERIFINPESQYHYTRPGFPDLRTAVLRCIKPSNFN